MKFMKLGSKPDTFETDGNKFVKYAVSDLDSDVTIIVGEVTFYLHKFPLLSKSNLMQRLVLQASEEKTDEIITLDIPGGRKAFEICAKFCYGMIVTLNAYNITSVRCAAEYLEMTEDVDRGNLIYKIEVFLNSGIFRSWKDSIIALQTTKSLLPWSEDLKLVGRCIDSVSDKILVNPEMVTWSYTHNRKREENVIPKDWWVEDVRELEIDMFKRVITAVKSTGRMNNGVIEEALRYYIARWIPESMESLKSEASSKKHLVETVVLLLPRANRVNRAMSYSSCSFLLKLLKVSILVGADEMVKEELIENVSLKLHEASVKDLLIHEVELVHRIVDQFMADEKRDDQYKEFVLGDGILLSVGRLIDTYLEQNSGLTLLSFVQLSELIPESARPIHDGLYKAIDTFLKEHPDLTKSEKKRLCSLMDVRKLSSEASTHAAQNERLPLRVVVQVLYFEQLRANHSPVGSVAASSHTPPLKEENKVTEEVTKKVELSKKSRGSKSTRSGGGALLMPSRSRRIFEKIWPGKGESSNKSSEVSSGSSESPTGKSLSSSSRRRRHSIS